MNVLLLNGSPHSDGCVATALAEVGGALAKHGIDSDLVQIGVKPVQGCIACGHCSDGEGCVFRDELYKTLYEKLPSCAGIVIGAPVYYAGAPGSLCAILDRLFYSAKKYLVRKPGACVVNCRRGGASSTFDRLNKYFTINQMPVVSSNYWNSTHGNTVEDIRQDLEGLQTMRTLGNNMAHLLKSLDNNPDWPKSEEKIMTNFI